MGLQPAKSDENHIFDPAAFVSATETNRGTEEQVRTIHLSRRFRVFLAAQPALAELQDALGDMFGAEAELLH